MAPELPRRSLLYLDPPYYVKGQQELYANYYGRDDHVQIAELLAGLDRPWLVTYDDIEEIRDLYAAHPSLRYGISYSANERYRGREIAFFSSDLLIPAVENPAPVPDTELREVIAAGL